MTELEQLKKEIARAREETRNLAKEKNEQIRQLTAQLQEVQKELLKKIELSQATADDGVTRAKNAQATADDGVTRAKNAQATADDGVTRANGAQATANEGVTKANANKGKLDDVVDRTQLIEISPNKKVTVLKNSTVLYAGDTSKQKYLAIQDDGNFVIRLPQGHIGLLKCPR